MNEQSDFERFVADQLANAGVGTPPANAIEDTIARAGGSRRLPEWLALIKEPPMRTSNHLAVGSPAVRVLAIMAATLLLALAIAAAGVAGQRLFASGPIVVAQDGSGTVETIAAAVAMAEDGGEILVRPGTYVEAVVIDKDIALKGDGEREDIVVMAPEDGPQWDTRFPWLREKPYAIVLAGSDGTVSGLTLRGEDSRLFVDDGAPTISGMLFDDVGTPPTGGAIARALIVTGGATASIHDNEFRGGNGINVFEYSVAHIEDNRLEGGTGIFGDFGDGTSIRHNLFSGTAPMAIRLGEPADILIEANDISDRERGIDSSNELGAATVRGNTITGADTAISAPGSSGQIIDNVLNASTIGISWSGEDGLIASNTVSGGVTGIIVGAGASVVRDNIIEGAENRGMMISRGSSPVLSGNTSCGNGDNVYVLDGATPEDDGTNEFCVDVATPE